MTLTTLNPMLRLLFLVGMLALLAPVRADGLPAGVSVSFLERWDVEQLNRILSEKTPAFAGVKVGYTPARNAVKLYRITYPSVIPERGNRPTVATGLLAIPDTGAKRFAMVSYQHGTVYGRQEVPSFPQQSPETELMIAQFAGQGYLLIGADYFGLGQSKEPEGYMVKASHQQATRDMLIASRAVLAEQGFQPGRLFLAGWSQGGFVTLAMAEDLERSGMPAAAAVTASAPVDLFAAMNGFLSFARPNDASWVPTLFMLTAFSYENYYALPGLARSVLTDAVFDAAGRLYRREPVKASEIPTELRAVVRPEYFDARFFAASAYGRIVASTDAYRFVFTTPVRTYYGEADEAITVGVGRMAQTYAQAMGTGNPKVEAISTGKTTHRGTFATAVPAWKAWFDALSRE